MGKKKIIRNNFSITKPGQKKLTKREAIDLTINEFDYLIDEAEGDYMDRINKDSLKVIKAKGEAFLSTAKHGERFQFIRKGYYVKRNDKEFNSIVSLKDGFK